MRQSKSFRITTLVIGLLGFALFKFRNLVAEKVHDWPVTITGSPVFGVKIDAGTVAQDSPQVERLETAAPFLLCKTLRDYPMSEYPFGHFTVQWAVSHEAIAMSPSTMEWDYDRIRKELVCVEYGIGDSHGARYTSVTDDKLFRIVSDAGLFGRANLRELQTLGCNVTNY